MTDRHLSQKFWFHSRRTTLLHQSFTFLTLSMQKNQEPVNRGQKQRLIIGVNMAIEVGIFNQNDWLLTGETKSFKHDFFSVF